MAPCQKRGKRTAAEAPPTEYENIRNQNIFRNSLALQRLGVSATASLLNSTVSKTTKKKAGAHENSGSLYEPEDSADIDQGVVDKVSKERRMNEGYRTGGTRFSKRVVAPDEEEQQPTRRTRQRTRELAMTENDTTSNPQEGADTCFAESENDIQISSEGEPDAMIVKPIRGRNMGKGLDNLMRGLAIKIPLHLSEGKRRPEAPIQAAKVASEGGIVLRQHIPILTHWKHYKKDESHLGNYMGKVAGQFAVDIKNKCFKEVCSDMLKCGQRQMRYRLKKRYFDDVAANQVPTTSPVSNMTDDHWRALVAMWSDPKHKV